MWVTLDYTPEINRISNTFLQGSLLHLIPFLIPNGIGVESTLYVIVNFDKFVCTCTCSEMCTVFGVLKDVNISI